jgi:hypothetical protein
MRLKHTSFTFTVRRDIFQSDILECSNFGRTFLKGATLDCTDWNQKYPDVSQGREGVNIHGAGRMCRGWYWTERPAVAFTDNLSPLIVAGPRESKPG